MSEPVEDVVAMGVPQFVTDAILRDPELRAVVLEKLEQYAWASVWAQWPRRKPLRLEDQVVSWLIAGDPGEVDRFQPAHDCEQCRLGNVKAREYLADHPGEMVALGNIRYVPVWEGLM